MRSRRKRTRIRCLRRFVKPGRLNMLTEICSIAATHASSSSCGAKKMEQETTKEKKAEEILLIQFYSRPYVVGY